jgi:carboxyl-terminal processing protease
MTFYRNAMKRAGWVVLLAFSLFFCASASLFADVAFDQDRTRVLSYVMTKQVGYHFSGKDIDDDLSQAAFSLYLKQLDSQKRLLLRDEVELLRAYRTYIDDEFRSGRITLAPLGAEEIGKAVERAEKIVDGIMAKPFDFSIDEDYETDPEKLDFSADVRELQERWRTELKFQTLSRYLTMMEDEGFSSPADIPEKQAVELEARAREKILKRHHDYFSRLRKETLQDHYDRYLNSIARAFDPHTAYLPPRSKEDFDISMRGSLEGIGATLREEDGFVKVVKVIPGSAADRQGQLREDDNILAVAQGDEEPVDITDMRLRDAVDLIRGKKGTEVRLTIKRPGLKSMVIPIIRDIVVIEESFVKSAVIEDPSSGHKVGYIRIPSFYRDFENTRDGGTGRNSTDDTRKAIQSFRDQKIAGLVLDLRNNGGGALTDAVGVAGLFIEEGPIVQVRTAGGQTKVLEDEDEQVEYLGPMVVLVNQFSASASEIVAGALQDYGRAIIVGSEHTHGKGTVQVVLGLDRALTMSNMQKYLPLGALKLTTQKFYRINGESTQSRGVVPDIVLPDPRQFNEFGEKYLDYSLPWDAIGPVRHKDWSQANLDKAELAERSRNRVAQNEEFIEISRISEVVAERLKTTRQSLQAEKVYHEWETLKDESLAHGGAMGAMGDDEEEAGEDSAEQGETPEQKLIGQVLKDPYALEAMAILGDLQHLGLPLAASTKAADGK